MNIQKSISTAGTYLSRTKWGFLILMFYIFCANLSSSFIPLFFKEQGYPLSSIMLLYVLYAAVGALFIPFMEVFHVRAFLIAGFFIFSLGLASLAFLPPALSFFLYAFLLGLNLAVFWIPLNYLFFKKSIRETNAVDSSLYMVIPGLISMIIPPIGAAFAYTFGYSWLFGVTALLCLLPWWFILKHIPKERSTAGFIDGITHFKGLKTITFCEGALQYFSGTVIVIYALIFLKTNLEVGFFLGYLGLVGFVIAIFLSRSSDKTQKRKGYIFILFLLMALSIIGLSLAKNSAAWYLAVGIFTIIYTVSSPLRLAVSLDVRKADMSFWKTREFFLNIGRVTTLSIAMVFFAFELYFLVFALFGIIALAYPFLVHHKLKEIQ